MYQRTQVKTLISRMLEGANPLIQVLVGPRQTGKSTMLGQASEALRAESPRTPILFVSADDTPTPNRQWVENQWQQARNMVTCEAGAVLIIDEIQKATDWARVVKSLWDSDQVTHTPLKVILSGSSSLLIHSGLEESLMGRFEIIHSPHWSFAECADAFDYSLDDFLYFGGFPGAARLTGDEQRWRDYIRNSIVEPTIALDALAVQEVRKPTLLRTLFQLGAAYSSREMSYTKMLGQLHDAGNTTTLASYLEVLGAVGMLTGLEKYHPSALTRKKSSPRFQVFDTALMTVQDNRPRNVLFSDTEWLGHLVESAVGAHLLTLSRFHGWQLYWWRDGNDEVDFVVDHGDHVTAIEVESGRQRPRAGWDSFLTRYPAARQVVIGGGGRGAIPLEEFLRSSDEAAAFGR
ncbi:MAG: ATP-binding protein [Corynebacterium sp.]|nr:ATP-binding protein [Corynebacterium sp.]